MEAKFENMLYKTARKSLTKKTNRHLRQTEFLYDLCDKDFQKLLKVEERLKNYFLWYCPGDKQEVEKVLALPEKFLLNDKKWEDGSKYFCLEEFYDVKLKWYQKAYRRVAQLVRALL